MSFFTSRANRIMVYALASALAVHFLHWDPAWLDRICQLIEVVAAANILKIGAEDAGARLAGMIPVKLPNGSTGLVNNLPK